MHFQYFTELAILGLLAAVGDAKGGAGDPPTTLPLPWLSPVYDYFYQFPLPVPPVKRPKYSYTDPATGRAIDYYEIRIKPVEQQIYPGLKKARLVGYDGHVPGPTFKMEKGREAVVRFINEAGDRANSVHLHGSYSRAPFDGWAEDTTEPGQYKDYYYPNNQSARTLWYHDHAVHHTAENAYYGQAGFYILHDPAEDAVGLPQGKYDVPLALAAKQYNADGTLFDPASETTSLYGDVIHVNGQPWPYLKVEPRKYRLRFLDTSISRAFKLYFEADDAPGQTISFTMIASDAGLLSHPVPTDNLEIAMAERWECIFDFTPYAGKNITLRNSRSVQADTDFNSTDKVMRFVVGDTVTSNLNNGDPPSPLREVPFPPQRNTVDKSFVFERKGGMWTVNGVTFSDVNNRIIAKPKRGEIQVWELENKSSGWSHPVHVHLVDFQVIQRFNGRPVLPYEQVALKDVVLLGRGEKIRVLARYAPWDGVYMFHCHNLIHEDHDMMAAFNVSSLSNWGYTETTRIVDPMDPRFRAKPIAAADFRKANIISKLKWFQRMNAYDADRVEQQLEKYWSTMSLPVKVAAPTPNSAPVVSAMQVASPTTLATTTTSATGSTMT